MSRREWLKKHHQAQGAHEEARLLKISRAVEAALAAAEAHGECLGGLYQTCGDDDCTREQDAADARRALRTLLGLDPTPEPSREPTTPPTERS